MAKGRKTGGRKAGTPNKATADARLACAQLVEGNIGKVQTWLNRVAKKSPGYAVELLLKICEYHIPKLARTEITGEDGNEVVVKLVDLTGRPKPPPPNAGT